MGQALDPSTYLKVFEPYSRFRLSLSRHAHKHVKLRRELGQVSSSSFVFAATLQGHADCPKLGTNEKHV